MQLWLTEKIDEKVGLTLSPVRFEAHVFQLPNFFKEQTQ
jgi:hypothetical protein